MGEIAYKPVEPFVEKNKTPYIQPQKTFLDFLRENGKLTHGFLSFQGSATNTLYTCPANYHFYLTSLSVVVQNSAVITIPTIDILLDNAVILTTGAGTAADAHESTIIDLSLPLKLLTGKKIECYNNRANCWVRIAYIGYLIPSNLSSQ